MTNRPFHQVDVFTHEPLRGNPLAVVGQAEGLSDAQMADFARWTNLSETTFLLPPTTPQADYRVRIFTPGGELPFAGHPTLGSCSVWLALGGRPRQAGVAVQECGVGLVRVRQEGARLAFAAPPLRRSGPVDADLRARAARALGLADGDLAEAEWVDNGAGWMAVLLRSRAQVMAISPDFHAMAAGGLKVGVAAPWDPAVDGGEAQFEVRAFVGFEDPVTGSLNAGLAQWLIGSGRAPARYVASQGTKLGRRGRVHIDRADDGTVWVGGDVAPCVRGTVDI